MTLSNGYALLVLHTTCRDDDNQSPLSSVDESTLLLPSNDEKHLLIPVMTQSWKSIKDLPIFCDLLIIPEYPFDGGRGNNVDTDENDPNNNDNDNDMHSSGSSSGGGGKKNMTIKLVENQFNPCGISNVLMLQDLSFWRDNSNDDSSNDGSNIRKDETLLLSLTSCKIVTNENKTFPVEPFPSTFDFSFDRFHDQETANGGDGYDQFYSSVSSITAELSLEFDLSLAKSIYERNMYKTVSVVEVEDAEEDIIIPVYHDSVVEAVMNIDVAKELAVNETLVGPSHMVDPEEMFPEQPKKSKIHCTEKPRDIQNDETRKDIPELQSIRNFYMDMCVAPFATKDEKHATIDKFGLQLEELLKLQARLDKEAETWDAVIGVLCLIGLVIFVLLLWSLRQLRHHQKVEQSMNEARESLLQKLRVGDDIDVQKTRPNASTVSTLSHGESRAATSQFVMMNPSKVKGIAQYVEPICLDAALEEAARAPPSPAEGSGTEKKLSYILSNQFGGNTELLTRESFPEKQKTAPMSQWAPSIDCPALNQSSGISTFVPFGEKNQQSSQSTPLYQTSAGPNFFMQSGDSTETSSKQEAQTSSPCSKLNQEWAAMKTVRRNNRKKKQSLLQPHRRRAGPKATSNVDTIDNFPATSSDTTNGSDGLIEPPSVRPLSHPGLFAPQTTLGGFVFGGDPESSTVKENHVPSIAISSEGNKGSVLPTSAGEIMPVPLVKKKPLVPQSKSPDSLPSVPSLCSTPASEDGTSFIEDYW